MRKLALVGRPNVGKSTLFNRLVGRRSAIVADDPGTTRDRREGAGRLADLEFTVVDTAGWEEAKGAALEARMRRQTEQAVKDADAVLFLIDARAGVTPLDKSFAQWLRAHARKTVTVANKCEGRDGVAGVAEAFGLGLGEPVPLSAEHGLGLADLRDALAPLIIGVAAAGDADEPDPHAAPVEVPEGEDADWEGGPEEPPDRPLQLAIVGRPNVGKSTLLNRLLGEDRVLTGPEAGITRDAIAVDWRFDGRRIRLIDTAGLRRRANVFERLETLSARDTLEAVRFAEVVVLAIDAGQMLEKQDLAIARMVVDEGRALVIAVNKIDALSRGDAKAQAASWRKLRDRLQASLAQVKGVPIVGLSAQSGRGVDKLMPAVMKIHALWNRRIPTAAFNRWLAAMVERNPPPLVDGRRIRIRYGAQVKTRPPTFALFVSKPAALPESYTRYLVNGLRDDFDLPGVPIRVVMRKPKNPYAGAED
ncbi:ribosome biogenesis GTPase Der [Vineibacter terrae]|uniref:GTPase Der n=1 Tax=Vineibacter terrae TaxID=2586908 RepID=A0A5C8PW92_9HYPH|nr:ribosome biogenesis GTPase Der [Vineibacter terrae]TXL82305.1 ribosome biogenesis GTPase Der [Vineibacter terrae]